MANVEMIVMGVSAGGLDALATILPHLSATFTLPVLIVQHLSHDYDNFLAEYLNQMCPLKVIEPEDKTSIVPGQIYIAPAGYHMLVEDKNTIALSDFPKVNFSQPSIDVLFESAAEVFKDKLLGIVLTGASIDGVSGAKKIKDLGGVIIVQSIETAEAKMMPSETIKQVNVDAVVDLVNIAPFLNQLNQDIQHGNYRGT